MSWGSFFDQSGTYSAQPVTSPPALYSNFDNTYNSEPADRTQSQQLADPYKAQSDYGQMKRPVADDNSYGYKRPRSDFGDDGYSGGGYNEEGYGDTGYEDGGYTEGPSSWDMLKEPANPKPKQEPMSWTDMTEITSWDQISTGKPSGGAGWDGSARGDKGRGRGNNSRGARGQFGGGKSGGGSGNGYSGRGGSYSGGGGGGYGGSSGGNSWGGQKTGGGGNWDRGSRGRSGSSGGGSRGAGGGWNRSAGGRGGGGRGGGRGGGGYHGGYKSNLSLVEKVRCENTSLDIHCR